jgi:GNAT superfamily N-acetyltransferase
MEEDHVVQQAISAGAIESVRALFQEYWTSFGFTPCFQNFDSEIATLPGKYAPPGGRLLFATVDGQPAGCVALRPFDTPRGEVKRLYVRPQFRGSGLGKALMNTVVAEACAIGYSELIADTIRKLWRRLWPCTSVSGLSARNATLRKPRKRSTSACGWG